MVKKMRIISAALAAVLAAASLTGCGTSGNSTATSADTSKSEVQTQALHLMKKTLKRFH